MFHWHYKDIFILLTDEEEMGLVRQLSNNDDAEEGRYYTSYEARKKYEKEIFLYLKNYLLSNPDEFNQKYVFRLFYDEDARKMLPHILRAYGYATKMAYIGKSGEHNPKEDFVEEILFSQIKNDICIITLLSPRLWPWSRPKATGRISFPFSIIEKIAGTVDNFVLMTTLFNVKFGRNFIRISVNTIK
jgi:hypothetical protein